MIADLEADRHYLFEGRDLPSTELAAHLLSLATQGERGAEVGPITFCTSASATAQDEFRIYPSHAPVAGAN